MCNKFTKAVVDSLPLHEPSKLKKKKKNHGVWGFITYEFTTPQKSVKAAHRLLNL